MEPENKKLMFWGGIALMLLIPALFLNLGKTSFNEDEGTRGVVAMEMIYQHDFVTPTISGEYYYNKPPFYNWIIASSFLLFGNFSPLALRFPMAVSVVLFGASVFFLMRKRVGSYFALILALATMTSGRILFYDSLHGLIDVTNGWLTFVLFISIYLLYERKKYYLLFLVAYLISASTFLMKGLPSIAFLGISLLTLFIYKRDVKRLFTLPHLAGILVFILLVGGYYVTYCIKNDNPLITLFKILFIEANKKSIGGNDIAHTVGHLFTFPFEYIGHFLPYTIFIIFFIKKKNRKLVWNNSFTKYLILVFFFNILIFWISPIVYARYLLMFIPLAYGVLMYPFMKNPEENQGMVRIMQVIFTIAMALFVLTPFIIALSPPARVIDNKFLKAVVMSVALAIPFIFYLKNRKRVILYFIISLILVRVTFNLLIIPIRSYDSWHFITKGSATRIGEKYKDQELCIYDEPSIYHEPDKLVLDKAVYFLSRERGRVVPLCTKFEPGKLYVITHSDYNPEIHSIIDHLYSDPETPLYVVKMK